MEKNNVSLELEEMRLQMAALQKQLNERLKLDEQQLQNSTMKKINAINRYGYFEYRRNRKLHYVFDTGSSGIMTRARFSDKKGSFEPSS